MEPPPPPVPAPDPTVHRHDGFYLRLGLGIGTFIANAKPSFGSVDATGTGLAFDIAIGGTPTDGLVIGGVLLTNSAATVHWKGDAIRETHDGRSKVDGDSGTLGLLGVFADYYPDPTGGFHVQAALGIGTLSFDSNRDVNSRFPPDKWSGGGAGAMLGVGYEAWIAKQWSLGGVFRVLAVTGSLRAENEDSGSFGAKGIAPALLFTGTYH